MGEALPVVRYYAHRTQWLLSNVAAMAGALTRREVTHSSHCTLLSGVLLMARGHRTVSDIHLLTPKG